MGNFGDFHPLVIHFPIVLYLYAFGCDLVGVFKGGGSRRVGSWAVIFAFSFCIPSLLTGLAADGRFGLNDPYLYWHRVAGFLILTTGGFHALLRSIELYRPQLCFRRLSWGLSAVTLVFLVLGGEYGGILTRGRTPFQKRNSLTVSALASQSENLSLDTQVSQDPGIRLEQEVTFHEVDRIFRLNGCIDCHEDLNDPDYPSLLCADHALSIDWLPASDKISTESLKESLLYQAIIRSNNMPPKLDDETPAGLALADRLLILQFFKNGAPLSR